MRNKNNKKSETSAIIEAIINNFSDGLLVFDKRDKLLFINPQAESFLKIKEKKARGKSISELSKIGQFGPLAEFCRKRNKKVFKKELKIKEDLILEATISCLRTKKEKIGTLIILHDVSRERLVEHLKTEFVSLTAHQMRTPLSSIKWILTMLLDEELGKINKEQKDFLSDGYKSNERMVELINDLLNVARIEEGRHVYKLCPTDFGDLVLKAIDCCREKFKKKRIKIHFEKSKNLPRIMLDVEKMRIVMDNLIENSLRYTLAGGKVEISLKGSKKEIKVIVKDSGMGIPKDQRGRVFSKFFRGSNVVKRETEGTGLGLFIVKNIIEAHNGKIWFESEEGRGTTFYFTLPIKKIK